MLGAEYFTHNIKQGHVDLTPCVEIIKIVFNSKGIIANHIRSIDGTSFARIEFSLNSLDAYTRALRFEPLMKVALNNEAVSMSKSGNVIAIEIPISNGTLYLGDMLAGTPYTADSKLTVPIGRTHDGQDVYGSLEELKHILVAGTTGSGKSVFMQSILISLLNKTKDIDIYIIDPKRVEFSLYNKLSNVTVYTELRDAKSILDYLCTEMEMRYKLIESAGARDITEYNRSSSLPMKRAVLMIDELADLMMQNKRQIEPLIVRLAQKARACGIHLIIATQYPKSDVLTGLIKMNMPTKVCFSTANTTGSVVVLGCKGAETLIGKGDMLYQTEKDIRPARLQGCFVAQNDIYVAIADGLGLEVKKGGTAA